MINSIGSSIATLLLITEIYFLYLIELKLKK